MKASDFISKDDQKKIEHAVKQAEHKTSGEIRVHIDSRCKVEVLDAAARVFATLGMHKTKLRNGVLIYLALEDKKFAIIGDAGINQKVSANFWDNIKNDMQEHFRKSDFTTGLIHGISMTGAQLKQHFPHEKDDVNELPDEISFGTGK
jgi:uncharacterized membrane protein